VGGLGGKKKKERRKGGGPSSLTILYGENIFWRDERKLVKEPFNIMRRLPWAPAVRNKGGGWMTHDHRKGVKNWRKTASPMRCPQLNLKSKRAEVALNRRKEGEVKEIFQ